MAGGVFRAGLYNDALIVCNMALEISPKFVVIHFTMANIYAAKVSTSFQLQEDVRVSAALGAWWSRIYYLPRSVAKCGKCVSTHFVTLYPDLYQL